ncbi:MAG: YceI family protein [Rhodobacteraceae bacterium]|nr:YceI family protein [Paracoccaceae bacterium]
MAITVGPDNLTASIINVSVRTRLIFTTEMLKSPSVLDTATHPQVRFVSHRIRSARDGCLSGGGWITDDLTVKGTIRTHIFDADLFRPTELAAAGLSVLHVWLFGGLSCGTFGTYKYAKPVGDTVTLDIRTIIRTA